MKKSSILLVILAVLCVFAVLTVFTLFKLFSWIGDYTTGILDQGIEEVDRPTEDNTTLGDYSIEIKSCRFAKDYAGEDVIIITYNFSNISGDEAQSFSWVCDTQAYQNGVGLNEAYILEEGANYDMEDRTKVVKQGGSLDVEIAYKLNDSTTDVEIEVKKLFSFSDKTIRKIFKIAQ